MEKDVPNFLSSGPLRGLISRPLPVLKLPFHKGSVIRAPVPDPPSQSSSSDPPRRKPVFQLPCASAGIPSARDALEATKDGVHVPYKSCGNPLAAYQSALRAAVSGIPRGAASQVPRAGHGLAVPGAGGDGSLGCSANPPAHIRKFVLRKKYRNLSKGPEIGNPTFFWRLTPPPPPGRCKFATKPWPGRGHAPWSIHKVSGVHGPNGVATPQHPDPCGASWGIPPNPVSLWSPSLLFAALHGTVTQTSKASGDPASVNVKVQTRSKMGMSRLSWQGKSWAVQLRAPFLWVTRIFPSYERNGKGEGGAKKCYAALQRRQGIEVSNEPAPAGEAPAGTVCKTLTRPEPTNRAG